jgi:ATP-dependent DNA ligase
MLSTCLNSTGTTGVNSLLRNGRQHWKGCSRGGRGVRFSEHIEGDGSIIFEHACKMGLEGIVSKRRDLPYRSGRVRSWTKVKNPASPAMLRIVEEGAW